MKMVSVSTADLYAGQQEKGSDIKKLQKGLAKLRGQGTSPGNTIIANNYENALLIGALQDRAIALAVRDTVKTLLEELNLV